MQQSAVICSLATLAAHGKDRDGDVTDARPSPCSSVQLDPGDFLSKNLPKFSRTTGRCKSGVATAALKK
ncbi:hypothetical protein HUJ04_000122 [Dendroctonus ponderosae]|nr:hypothetical protein HUJ04_000122 [Dendroctonus ponderosae]